MYGILSTDCVQASRQVSSLRQVTFTIRAE